MPFLKELITDHFHLYHHKILGDGDTRHIGFKASMPDAFEIASVSNFLPANMYPMVINNQLRCLIFITNLINRNCLFGHYLD